MKHIYYQGEGWQFSEDVPIHDQPIGKFIQTPDGTLEVLSHVVFKDEHHYLLASPEKRISA